MRILILLQYPGFVRYFDSVVRELLARGHAVQIAFNGNWKQPEGLAGLPKEHPLLAVDPDDFPVRWDRYRKRARDHRGTVDFVRYLDRRFRKTPWLRQRSYGGVPSRLRFLTWLPSLPTWLVEPILRRLMRYEQRKIPSAPNIEAYLAAADPDLLVVSPLVNPRSWQTDAVKSAKALGIPTAVCVASWDHLTTKGLLRIETDKVFVWNEIQKREAVEFHFVPAGKVVVTGAQPFDKWYDRRPSLERPAFLKRAGFAEARPYVLFVGSTSSISDPGRELAFVRRWIAALRRRPGPLREIGIMVRPHPFNADHWRDAVIDDPLTVVYPRGSSNPVDETDRADYYHSIFFSEAVLGINTSAMVEATILGKPVLSVLDFESSQEGTLHFQYLLPENGGFLEVARTLEEHADQLGAVLAGPRLYQDRAILFADRFVRPLGRTVKATPVLVDGLEAVARLRFRGSAGSPTPHNGHPVAAVSPPLTTADR